MNTLDLPHRVGIEIFTAGKRKSIGDRFLAIPVFERVDNGKLKVEEVKRKI